MNDTHLFVSKHGLWSKFIMLVLLIVICLFSAWALMSTRTGADIAMVMGATLTPMVGLFKYVLEYADRKNESHQ